MAKKTKKMIFEIIFQQKEKKNCWGWVEQSSSRVRQDFAIKFYVSASML